MSLGKRPRGPMRRTTSMTGIAVDLPSNVGAGSSEPSDDTTQNHQMIIKGLHATAGLEEGSLDYHNKNNMMDTSCGENTSGFLHDQPFLASVLSPRNHHKSSGSGNHFVEDSHFLRTCGLCKRRLAPGKDLYMYRYVYIHIYIFELFLRFFLSSWRDFFFQSCLFFCFH